MIIKHASVFQPEGSFIQKDIFILKDKFVSEEVFLKADKTEEEAAVYDAQGLYAIPGLVDIHFHGCAGFDFCDGTQEAIQAIADYELSCGITSIVPATMTYDEPTLTRIMEQAAAFANASGAVLRGINMEGPFISRAKMGAQNPKYIKAPDAAMFNRLQRASKDMIRFCDIAPEEPGAIEFIDQVKQQVTVSLAHTMADYDKAMEAFDHGATHVTHLYNAMPPFSHRAPGVIGAAVDQKQVYAELICDGIHIHPSVVRTTFQMFGDDRICMISDSMMATGLQDGIYSLGGQDVVVKGNQATLADGTIAGSATNLMDCMRTAVVQMGIPFSSAAKCVTVNPAKAAGIYDQCGSIEEGKTADIVLLDEKLQIAEIIGRGQKH